MTTESIVRLEHIDKEFPVRGRTVLQRQRLLAVNDVSLSIESGETVGLVGESGSGKSTVANLVGGLLRPTRGLVVIRGVDTGDLRGRRLRDQRRDVQMVFQDPYSSLAPMSTIEAALMEPFRAHHVGDRATRRRRVDELLDRVGLDRTFRNRFPSELSGGQLQRVGIARALALDPQVLVLDEPVSALDVSTKADIINLLADLKASLGLTYLFISHDLGTLRVLADRLAVMYLGRIVEEGPADEIYVSPRHPYTRALLGSVPVADPVRQRARERIVLGGDMPSPLDAPAGCAFNTRCPAVMPICREARPASIEVDGVTVSCHLHPAVRPDPHSTTRA